MQVIGLGRRGGIQTKATHLLDQSGRVAIAEQFLVRCSRRAQWRMRPGLLQVLLQCAQAIEISDSVEYRVAKDQMLQRYFSSDGVGQSRSEAHADHRCLAHAGVVLEFRECSLDV